MTWLRSLALAWVKSMLFLCWSALCVVAGAYLGIGSVYLTLKAQGLLP